MSQTGKVNKLKQHISESQLEIHPDNGIAGGIRDNQLEEIVSRQGLVRVKTKYSTDIKKGVVFLPMHWGKILNNDLNRANNLTANVVDPKSKEPDFKFTAVQVKRYEKPVQKIIVIGAGAGTCGFVKSYRALKQAEQIIILSKENFPFYNRVLLPDYISGALPWDNLVKMTDKEEMQYKIKLHRGVGIDHITRESKTVTDSTGQLHQDDILLIATGGRAAMLKDVPSLKGIFTLRSRMDADSIKEHIDPDLHRYKKQEKKRSIQQCTCKEKAIAHYCRYWLSTYMIFYAPTILIQVKEQDLFTAKSI